MKKSNVLYRKTVLFLAFLLQGLMATVTHAVGVGGSADADAQYKGAVQPLRIDFPRDIMK